MAKGYSKTNSPLQILTRIQLQLEKKMETNRADSGITFSEETHYGRLFLDFVVA